MPGLSRFDFYPRDWLAGTRTLSSAAKGVYIDLLAVMYDRGEAIDADPKWLCRLLGFRDKRQLQPILDELIADRKIEIRDGRIHNRRADAEIEKAHRDMQNGAKGGRPRKQKAGAKPGPEGDQKATSEAPAASQRPRTTLFTEGRSEEKQTLSENPPSPSPSPITPCTPLSAETEGIDEPPEPPPKRGRRIPPDWRPTDADRAFAVQLGFTASEIDGMAAEFRDYWAAVPGAKGRKLDWPATWRNRCRQRAGWKAERQVRTGYGTPDGDGSDLASRILARKQREQHGRLQ